MAERVYRKKANVTMGMTPSAEGVTLPAAPTASVSAAPPVGDQPTGQRVYRKKATAPDAAAGQTPQRTYSIRPEVKAQKLQTWGESVSALSKDVTTYFDSINAGTVPTEDAYNQMIARIDQASAAAKQHRASFADNAEVSAYVDDISTYLDAVRETAERYRGGLTGALKEEMAQRVQDGAQHSAENHIKNGTQKKSPPKATIVAMPENLVSITTPEMALHSLRARNANAANDDPTILPNAAALGASALVGLAKAGHTLYQGADWLLPDEAVSELFGVENKVGQFFDDRDKNMADVISWKDQVSANATDGYKKLGDKVISPTVTALPNLLVAVASGGATAAASLGASGGSTFINAVSSLVKNPSFWMSFVQSGGSAYSSAKESGANEMEAQAVAWLTAFPSAVVEIGGGIEKIPQTSGGVLSFVRNAVEEGGEEVLQGIIEQAARTIVFEHENQWLDLMNVNSVISIPRATQEFLGGVTVGAVLGAGTSAVRYSYQNYQHYKLGSQYINGETITAVDGTKHRVSIDDAIAIGLNNAKGTDAYNAAVTIQQQVADGETISPYAVGRMVVESHTEQALRAKAIEAEVLESGAAVGYDAEAVDTVARAAVALNQRVRFATQGELTNANNAAEYHRDSDTVLLNPVLTDVNKMLGEMMAHELAHAAEGTKQLATLAKIAQRMEGTKWESRKAGIQKEYANTNQPLDPKAVEKEAVAAWIGENLFRNKAFAKAVADGDANVGNAFFYMIDRVRRAMGAKKASAGNLAMLERLFMQALDNRTIGPKEGDVQGVIAFGPMDKDVLGSDAREVMKILHNNYEKIPSNPVFSVKMENDASSFEKKSEYILDIFQKQGGIAHNSVLGDVELSKKGAKSTIMHGYNKAKLASVWAIKDVIERGAIVHTEPQYQGKEIDRHIIAARGYIDGAPTYMGVVVASYPSQPKGTNAKFYLHEAVIIDAKKEAGFPSMTAPQLSVDTVRKPASNTNVAQNAPDVNTQSMQEGAGVFTEDGGNSAQGALLPPEYRPGARVEGVDPNAVEGAENPSVADADTSPYTGEVRAVEDARPYGEDSSNGAESRVEPVQVDEAAVLDTAMRSQLQGKQRVAVDTSSVEGIKDVNPYLDKLVAELGAQELLRRMYNATRMDRPTGMVNVDGHRVDANAYMDAYEQSLPKDVKALERHIEHLQEQRTAEVVKMEQEGTLKNYQFGGLKIDLQLFAANRLWDLLQLDEGESGTEVRQFYEKRLRGTDAIHNQELIDMLATNEETYDPIGNKETLREANQELNRDEYKEKLIDRIGRYDPKDLFDRVEVAAGIELVRRAINDGELDAAANLIIGLSRKGTEAGRAVQAFSMMARMTPEGTLKAAVRTLQREADNIIGEGANKKLDVLADDIARAIKEAEGKGISSEEIADRIRNGGLGQSNMEFDTVPDGFARKLKDATGTDVLKYKLVLGRHAIEDIIKGEARADDTVRTIIDTGSQTLYVVTQNDTGDMTTIPTPPQGKSALPRGLSREELVQMLSDDLAREQGNFLTKEEISDLLWKTVDEATNIPEQLKRYVLKKIRKDDGGLAQRIYELHKRGDLKQVKLRRAMEQALELPTLTDDDLTWLAQQGAKIENLQDKPVEQADAMEELYDFLGAKLTVTGLDRLQAWRKFGMLFNVKTHLRNVFSNWAYSYVRKADDAVAMAIERLFVRDRSKWSTALGWSHTEHGQNILPQLQEQAELAVLEMQKRGAKYEGTGTGMIKQKRKFFGESKAGELLNSANRKNSEWLEREDIKFFRPAYIDALGQIMTAREVTEITPELHGLAMQRALEATFRADNMLSDVISSLKRFQNESSAGKRLFGHAVDVVIPFHKTPANIAGQIVMHSPIGIVKGAYDLVVEVNGKGSKDAAVAINEMAKGVTGTALLIIGLLLGSAGLFNTGFGKTEKERAADEMEGLQEGSFVIAGVSVSLDWLQPAASPLVVGASVAERLKEGGFTIGDVFGAVMDGTDSLFEMTMLQSLYDILGGYDAGASGTMMSVGENVVSQSVPTLVGQVARAIDPVQRKTKGDSDFETIVNQVVAKIPGLTYLLDPELDVWGNEVYRTGKPGAVTTVLNALQQIVIPANTKVGTGNGDPISQEILRLYKDQGGAVIPTAITRDEAKDAGEDYVDVNQLLGGVNRLAVEAFVGNEKAYDVMVETGGLTDKGNPKKKKVTKYYRDMTDDERRRVLSNIYQDTKSEVTGKTEDKTENQLTDSERYIRDLLRRVRSGEKGTTGAAAPAEEPTSAPAQEQASTSYYDDLLRRMRNGN